MFYGLNTETNEKLSRAVNDLMEIYPGQVYAQDMMICLSKSLAFTHDEKFMSSFTGAVRNDQEKSLLWRLHVAAWAATTAMQVDGDFVECGVFKGFTSRVLCQYLQFEQSERQFYLYDTFAGLPEATSTEAERQAWSSYGDLDSESWYQEVYQSFTGYANVSLVRGVVPDSFAEQCPDRIAYLHLDMNSEQAEMAALEHLFDKVVPGGLILLDDYGWTAHANQTRAELKFMLSRGQMILEVPTGQGLILKHG